MNRKILSVAAILVVVCALLIALGIRQDNKAVRTTSKAPGSEQVQQDPTDYPDPITATLAV